MLSKIAQFQTEASLTTPLLAKVYLANTVNIKPAK
jgi:hypothetical protein